MQTVSAGSCVFHKMPGRSQKAQSAASAEVRGQQKVLVSSVIPFPLVIFFVLVIHISLEVPQVLVTAAATDVQVPSSVQRPGQG